MKRFNEKVMLITGATAGIGRKTALRFGSVKISPWTVVLPHSKGLLPR